MNSKTSLLTLVAAACLVGCSTTSKQKEPSVSSAASAPSNPLSAAESKEARQAAANFLQAVAKEDWNAVAKFWPPNSKVHVDSVFNEKTKAAVGGLQVVSLGDPYRDDSKTSGVFVPYEVRFRNGSTQKNSLHLKKGPGGRWIWLGGF